MKYFEYIHDDDKTIIMPKNISLNHAQPQMYLSVSLQMRECKQYDKKCYKDVMTSKTTSWFKARGY